MYYPVESTWYPTDDLRRENQSRYNISDQENPKIIALDPGVRKFLTGYDPINYRSILIGANIKKEIIPILLEIDYIQSNKLKNIDLRSQHRRVKNLIQELHCKVVSYLVENYDIILLPTFETSKMVRSKKLTRMTKRLMNVFSFYKFRQRLEYKCKVYNKQLIIVDESYTSKTCTCCGEINKELGTSEEFKCPNCKIEVDRDVQSARNILIKNIRLRWP